MDVDDLYGLPLDQFVPERTVLVRELRKVGERDRASEVAALRKPSVAAWAVNQLVRTQRKPVADLLKAGDALRAAQDDVLSGRGDGRSLRAAVERERAAVDALTEAARGLLSSGGDELSETMIERVSDTLHAAALDDDARAQVSEGRLERELQHVGLGGFGALGGGPPAAPAPRTGKRADKPDDKRAEKRPEKRPAARKTESGGKVEKKGQQAGGSAERESDARERAKAHEEARRAARATEREARRRAERAERAQVVAGERRDRAVEALRDAQADLDAADAALEEARAELRAAEAASRDLAR